MLNTEYRLYDPRLAQWLTRDPVYFERLWVSPYNFAQDNPILRYDPNGLLDLIYREYYDYETKEYLGNIDDGVEIDVLVTKEHFKELQSQYDNDIKKMRAEDPVTQTSSTEKPKIDYSKLSSYNNMVERYSIGEMGYDIAQTAKKYEGSEDWSYEVKKDNFDERTYKCNKFVIDVIRESGDNASVKERPPRAAEWANADYVKNFVYVNSNEKPRSDMVNIGDIIAASYPYSNASGHVVIVTDVDIETGKIKGLGTVNSFKIGDDGFANNMVNNNGKHGRDNNGMVKQYKPAIRRSRKKQKRKRI